MISFAAYKSQRDLAIRLSQMLVKAPMLKPALDPHMRRRIDEIDRKLGFN